MAHLPRFEIRQATEAERRAVLALGVAEEEAWFGSAESSAGEVGEWIDEEGGLAQGMAAIDPDGRVRGFASPGRHSGVFLADPPAADAAAEALLPWLLGRDPKVQLLAYAGDSERIAAYERHGLSHLRSSFSLVRPHEAGALPAAEPPAGATVAPYRLGEDDQAVHRLVFVDAEWAAVPGHTGRDFEAWRESMSRCPHAFLARRDGRPAGWVAGRILDSGRGYVDMLAVAARERRAGLGRALLLRAFGELQRAGARGLALDVAAANEQALGLYRSVGLQIEREWRTFARP